VLSTWRVASYGHTQEWHELMMQKKRAPLPLHDESAGSKQRAVDAAHRKARTCPGNTVTPPGGRADVTGQHPRDGP